jgi:hypothetical protein
LSSLTTDQKLDKVIKFLETIYGPDLIDGGVAEVVTRPTEGKIKPGGWKANTDPDNWKVEVMKDNPALFKVVDNDGKNVATDFSKKEIAEQYIKWFVINENPGEAEPEEPKPGEEPKPTPAGQLGPYKTTGKEITTTKRRAVRHYASGKDDDETVELNGKKIPFDNYQFINTVTMGKMNHEDNISTKLGGVHMGGSGWYDHGVSIMAGQTCLGTEPKHPDTNACIKKGAKIGDLRDKEVMITATYFKQEDRTELWTKLPGEQWVKQLEAVGLDGLDPSDGGKRKENETQLRIDGFNKSSEPKIAAVVQEIAV